MTWYRVNTHFLFTMAEIEKEFYKYSALTQKIIGSAMRVHSTLGRGFPEVVYQRALALELTKQQLLIEREVERTIFYDNQPIGSRRVDFLVEGKIVLELKATSTLDRTHVAQTINYLEVLRLEVALLLNFGSPSLQFRRLVNTRISPHT